METPSFLRRPSDFLGPSMEATLWKEELTMDKKGMKQSNQSKPQNKGGAGMENCAGDKKSKNKEY